MSDTRPVSHDHTRCPLCGLRLVYRGLTSVECVGSANARAATSDVIGLEDCPNYRRAQPAPSAAPGPVQDLAWARAMHARGLKVEYRSVYSGSPGAWRPCDPGALLWELPRAAGIVTEWRLAPGQVAP